MATPTPNMGLTEWDLASDPYDHTQLAANFVAIDAHDHSVGKGVQIPTGGIADGAITNSKLATNAVSTIKVQDGAITAIKMDREYVHPLGEFMWWWRPNTSIAVPTGWVVCRGQVLTSADHDFPGGGSITVPDVINKFILGADTSGTGIDPASPPAIGATGGSHTLTLAHTHTIPAHYHSKGTLEVAAGGWHGHNLYTNEEGGTFAGHSVAHSQAYDIVFSGIIGASPHSHPNTDFSGFIGNTSGTFGDNQMTSGSSLGSATDSRNAFIGFLPLLKVKY